MAKTFGILLIVLGIWAGLEIYTEGTDRAFGGVFASLGSGDAPSARAPLEAIEDRARAARDRQLDRIERQIPTPDPIDED